MGNVHHGKRMRKFNEAEEEEEEPFCGRGFETRLTQKIKKLFRRFSLNFGHGAIHKRRHDNLDPPSSFILTLKSLRDPFFSHFQSR